MADGQVTENNATQIIIIQETLWQSVERDISAFILVFAVTGSGRWIGSEAMQWCGFACLCLGALTLISRPKRMTPKEAADYLETEFSVRAGTP